MRKLTARRAARIRALIALGRSDEAWLRQFDYVIRRPSRILTHPAYIRGLVFSRKEG